MQEPSPTALDTHPSAFPGYTGEGFRVAVIDSGVNADHPHIDKVCGGVTVGVDALRNVYTDFLGHGTAVMAAIQEKAPRAEYYAVKIYFRSLTTDIQYLLEGIQWAVDNKANVINLSLGTTNPAHRESLSEAIEKASSAGIIFVAAAQMGTVEALPGSLPGVIGVNA